MVHPEQRDHLEGRWREGDDFAYADSKWSGEWLFFTKLGEEIIGFACWDPRSKPVVIIGHNCIKPSFRGRGYGIAQMRHALAVLKTNGFAEVVVTTDDDPFFVPAQRMYERCGFRETGRGDITDPFPKRLIEYRLNLKVFPEDVKV